MNNRKEKHACASCLHYEVCEYSVYKAEIICDDYIDRKIFQRSIGRWISLATNQSSINPGRSCSICGKTVQFSENFCPECGAYMRGEEDE